LKVMQSYAQTMSTTNGSCPHLVLAGAGHAQLAVLHALRGRAPGNLAATLVTPGADTVYSGMLPGWMAGQYALEDLAIPCDALALAAGVDVICARVVALDAAARVLRLSDGRQLGYDLLSLDIGGSIEMGALAGAPMPLPVRPLEAFTVAWPQVCAKAAGADAGWRLAVVGAGAAGVELALAAEVALRRANAAAQVTLVEGADGLLPGHAASVRARITRTLAARGIERVVGPARGHRDGLLLGSGTALHCDAVIACTGSQPPDWLRETGLALDMAGRVQVDAYQRSVSHPEVFAAGDVSARIDMQLPASGVHAVRAGPVLAHNLLASLRGARLETYQPRRRTLYLLACGDGTAVASWGRWSAEGKWVWRWKDSIDRRFVRLQRDTSRVGCKETGC
jgi:pyridine nucleotide-disulfide oxidoreductase family protein